MPPRARHATLPTPASSSPRPAAAHVRPPRAGSTRASSPWSGTALRVIAPAVKQYRLALRRVVARGAYCGYRWIKPRPRAGLG